MALVDTLEEYGFEVALRSGTGWLAPDPAIMLLHTTEGDSWQGALSALDGNRNWSHLLLDYEARKRLQLVRLNEASKSLMNRSGGVETNRDGPIQVEIVQRAAHTHEMSDAEVDWLAESLAPLYILCGIDPSLTVPFVDQRDGWIARADAPQRMSFETWRGFNGTCGHQHVPENDHWDPGRFRIDRFLSTVRSGEPARPRRRRKGTPVFEMFTAITDGRRPWQPQTFLVVTQSDKRGQTLIDVRQAFDLAAQGVQRFEGDRGQVEQVLEGLGLAKFPPQ